MKKIRLGAFLGMFGLLFFANLLVFQEVGGRRALELHILNVGQGDALLIQTRQGHDILIDGGPGGRVAEELGKEMALWNRDIELMVLTHPDADHVTGLVEVLRRYRVDTVLWTGVEKDTRVFRAFQEAVLGEGAGVVVSEKGQEITWQGRSERMRVLYPGEQEKRFRETNETSLVLQLQAPAFTALLTGDIGRKGEEALLGEDIAADVLKVPHHGSNTSSTAAFLGAVAPRLAVISVGADNRFGHPHPAVLARLAEYGIQVLRTDEQGTVSIRIPAPKRYDKL